MRKCFPAEFACGGQIVANLKTVAEFGRKRAGFRILRYGMHRKEGGSLVGPRRRTSEVLVVVKAAIIRGLQY
jgi:hypothetical protein